MARAEVGVLNLSAERWTVIARSYQSGQWRSWAREDGKPLGNLYADAMAEKIILMQRRGADGWQLVARRPSPSWLTVQRWRMRRPLALPQVRRWRA